MDPPFPKKPGSALVRVFSSHLFIGNSPPHYAKKRVCLISKSASINQSHCSQLKIGNIFAGHFNFLYSIANLYNVPLTYGVLLRKYISSEACKDDLDLLRVYWDASHNAYCPSYELVKYENSTRIIHEYAQLSWTTKMKK